MFCPPVIRLAAYATAQPGCVAVDLRLVKVRAARPLRPVSSLSGGWDFRTAFSRNGAGVAASPDIARLVQLGLGSHPWEEFA
jgi:hypothetical protein